MAGYNYASRGGFIDDRNRASYGEDGYSSEHVCRPVIVDAEGRKRPIISYVSPNVSSESYVTTTTETIVEHVRAPVVLTDYNNSHAKIEPLKDYGVTNDKWSYPSNQVYDRTEYRYSSPPKREPMRSYGVTNDNWRNNPTKAEDFVKKVPTEVRRPTRPGLLSATQWRNTPTSTGQGYGSNNDYGGQYANYNTNTNNSTPLSGIINEIGQATEILNDAVKPSSIAAARLQSQSPILASTAVPRRDGSYTDSIDSREAARRYGNMNLSSRPIQTGETYTGTIDSREAARRYNGARV